MHGVEFQEPPSHNPDIPIVADMSSNILSKELDISKVGHFSEGVELKGYIVIYLLAVENNTLANS